MKPSVKRRLERDIAIITELAQRWPQCFSVLEARRRPLKIGIDQDIIVQLDTIPGVTCPQLKRSLGRYVYNHVYLAKLTVGAERVDLDGAGAGLVTEDRAEQARADRARMLAAREARKARVDTRVCPPPLPPAPAPPQRDGLAQLRAAAQRRKAANVASEMKMEVEYQG